MKKTIFAIVTLVMLFAGCSKELTPEEKAQEAALAYYNSLLAGDYAAFLGGRANTDSLPDSYREGLLKIYQQFLVRQQEEHGGVVSIEANRACIDSTLNVMQVFMNLNFADSTKEEIVVQMIEHEGEWKMR